MKEKIKISNRETMLIMVKNGEVAAISSKHFFGYQLPGPDWVQAAVRNTFE